MLLLASLQDGLHNGNKSKREKVKHKLQSLKHEDNEKLLNITVIKIWAVTD